MPERKATPKLTGTAWILMITWVLQDTYMVVGLDKKKDGDKVTNHLEQQTVVVEHDHTITGLNLWEKGGSVATIGADQRLNIFSPSLALVHTSSTQPMPGSSALWPAAPCSTSWPPPAGRGW